MNRPGVEREGMAKMKAEPWPSPLSLSPGTPGPLTRQCERLVAADVRRLKFHLPNRPVRPGANHDVRAESPQCYSPG